MKKTFILDTNVILHDSRCFYNFAENDVIIPMTVIEEIDQFKRGHDLINFHAREFVRLLDEYPGEQLVNGGATIREGSGRISICTIYKDEHKVASAFMEPKADHRILSAALHIQREHPEQQVILVSKDVNLRLKAKSLGLFSQDYYNDKIKDIDNLYRGKRLVENADPSLIEQLYTMPFEVPIQDAGLTKVMANEYFILRNHQKSVLAYYNPLKEVLERVDKNPAYGIIPRNAEQTFAIHALTSQAIKLVSLSGKAGTGKTLLALASALEVHKNYRQIFLARPVVALSNKDLGYLPGDIASKLDPYMQPLYDNLGVIRDQFAESDQRHKRIQNMLENGKLEIAPLAYIRGRSLDRIFFIVDEAQNLTPHEVKTIITRAGEGTKVIFTGDPQQIDTPYLDSRSTGLNYLVHRMQGQPIYSHITLEKGERSELAELASDLL